MSSSSQNISLLSPLPPLTLILATTPTLGLGFRGTLPWPLLKPDLAFFARVTKRPPPPSSFHSPPLTSASPPNYQPQEYPPKTINAVLMGRKTWLSIPPSKRPLRDRINVVLSRQPESLAAEELRDGGKGNRVLVAGSIEEGLRRLHRAFPPLAVGAAGADASTRSANVEGGGEERGKEESKKPVRLGRVFVIGGAEIYATALEMDCCERVLWTRLEREWECDVWFPGGVLVDDGGKGGRGERGGWVRRGREELEAWCGEAGAGERREDGGVGWRVEMWERERSGANDRKGEGG